MTVCVICDKLGMRVVPVVFDGIPAAEQQAIVDAIEEIYEAMGLKAYVIDEYRHTRRRCPAYRQPDGMSSIVHIGHCKGLFEGVKKCPYYDGSKPTADEQCRYGKGRGVSCV